MRALPMIRKHSRIHAMGAGAHLEERDGSSGNRGCKASVQLYPVARKEPKHRYYRAVDHTCFLIALSTCFFNSPLNLFFLIVLRPPQPTNATQGGREGGRQLQQAAGSTHGGSMLGHENRNRRVSPVQLLVGSEFWIVYTMYIVMQCAPDLEECFQ